MKTEKEIRDFIAILESDTEMGKEILKLNQKDSTFDTIMYLDYMKNGLLWVLDEYP